MSSVAAVSSEASSAPTPGIESGSNGDTNMTNTGDVVADAIAHVTRNKPQETDQGPVADKPGPIPAKTADKPTESAEQTTKKPIAEDAPKAAAWAKLHEQKKELFAKEQSFKEREAKLAAFEKAARTDKFEALKLLGYEDPKSFVEEVAENGGKVDPNKVVLTQLQKEVEALRQEKAKEQQLAQEAKARAEYQQGVDRHQKAIVDLITTDPKFSKGLVSMPGGKDRVFQVMQEHYQKTQDESGSGEVLPYAKAAEIVESQWESNLKEIAEHPRAREILTGLLSKLPQKPGAASNKQPNASKPKVDSLPAKPEVEPETDGEKLLEEANNWLKQRARARREY